MPSAGKPGMEGRPACRQAGSEVFLPRIALIFTDCRVPCSPCLQVFI